MAYVNYQRSYIRFKLVYYGPGLCGKTTNLEQLNEMSGGQVEMVSLETEGDRTIFFDYMPLNLGKLGGVETVLKLYTVPGQVRYNRTRRMVLRDVDGVVFVADSQRAAMTDNIESMRNLEENLAEEGIDIGSIPMILQYNKRDLDDVATVEELDAALNPRGLPTLEAVAVQGHNVKETLTALSRMVYREGARRYGLSRDDEGGEAASEEESPADSWSRAPSGTDSTPAEVVEERWSSPPGERLPSRSLNTMPPQDGMELRSDADGTSGAGARMASELERKIFMQYVEMREILQQIVMTQLEQDSLEDFRADVSMANREIREAMDSGGRKLAAIGTSVSRLEDMIVELARGMTDLQAGFSSLRDDIHRDIRKEVDKQLADFLADFESSHERADQLIPVDDDPPAGDRGGMKGLRHLRETSAPPRKRSGPGGYYNPGSEDR